MSLNPWLQCILNRLLCQCQCGEYAEMNTVCGTHFPTQALLCHWLQTLIKFLKSNYSPQSELYDWMVLRAAHLQYTIAARAAAHAQPALANA